MGSSSPSVFLAHWIYSKQERAVPCLLQQTEQSREPSVSALLTIQLPWQEVGQGRSLLSMDSVSSGASGHMESLLTALTECPQEVRQCWSRFCSKRREKELSQYCDCLPLPHTFFVNLWHTLLLVCSKVLDQTIHMNQAKLQVTTQVQGKSFLFKNCFMCFGMQFFIAERWDSFCHMSVCHPKLLQPQPNRSQFGHPVWPRASTSVLHMHKLPLAGAFCKHNAFDYPTPVTPKEIRD